MTEGLFVLTTLFVAYVIYTIVNEKKADGDKSTKSVAEATQKVQQASVSDKPKAAAPKTEAKPAPKPTVAKKAVAKPAAKPIEAKKTVEEPAPMKAAAKPVETKKTPEPTSTPEPTAIKGTGLKDPKTGEVATSYSNYRFTKRWIKEALVAEKLLEKVYKNDELNANVEGQIKAAIIKLEGMKKYKP